MIQGEAITKLITSLAKPRLNSLPGLLDAFDNKRALYDNRFMHDEKGMKANPLPSKSVNRKARGNAMANQNLPSFISSNSTNDPLSTKSSALLVRGEKAKATKLLREATIIPRDTVETMMIRTRSPKKISE